MTRANFRTALDNIVAMLGENANLRKADCAFANAFWNPARIDNPQSKYRFKVYYFGSEQSDNAGVLDLIHYWAIVGRVAPLENFDKTEADVMDVTDAIVRLVHRNYADNYTSVFQKEFVFYSPMTVTSNARRVTVPLRDGEIGVALFFWSARATVYALAKDARVPEEESKKLVANASGKTWDEEVEDLTSAQTTQATAIVGLADDQIF